MVIKIVLLIMIYLTTFTTAQSQSIHGNNQVLHFVGNIQDTIQSRLVYPRNAIEDGIDGKVEVSYYVDENGHVNNPTIINGLRKDFDDEALRVIQTLRYEPMRNNTKLENMGVSDSVTIYFKRQNKIKIDSTRLDDAKYTSFLRVKQMRDSLGGLLTYMESAPGFKGDLLAFLKQKIAFPKSLENKAINEKVFVYFEVDTIGSTFNHQILKGSVYPEINEDAIRVAKLLSFSPAKMKGFVYSDYTVPITYKNTQKK